MHEQQLVEILVTRTFRGRDAGVHFERAGERADVGDASVRDEDPARATRLGRRDDHAAACATCTLDALHGAHDVFDRCDAVAQASRVLEAAAVDEILQAGAQARQCTCRILGLFDA